MAIDTQAPISRRGLLAAALGGLAAAAAGTVAGAQRAFAAGSDGETVVIGGFYDDVQTATRLRRRDGGDHIVLHSHTGPSGGSLTRKATISGDEIVLEWEGFKSIATGHLSPPRASAGSLRQGGAVGSSHAGGDAGVWGHGPTGVRGRGDRVGVIGGSETGRGVRGWGERGGHFSGTEAQVRLQPSGRATHPNKGRKGDLFVDRSARLWFCKGGTTWRRVA